MTSLAWFPEIYQQDADIEHLDASALAMWNGKRKCERCVRCSGCAVACPCADPGTPMQSLVRSSIVLGPVFFSKQKYAWNLHRAC
jgi:hypothetical protein